MRKLRGRLLRQLAQQLECAGARLPLETLLAAGQQRAHGRFGGVGVEGRNEGGARSLRRLAHRLDLQGGEVRE